MMMNLVLIIDNKKYQVIDTVAVLECEYEGFIQYNMSTTKGIVLLNVELWGNNNNYAVVTNTNSL